MIRRWLAVQFSYAPTDGNIELRRATMSGTIWLN